MKKIISFLIAAVMLISCLVIPASATEVGEVIGHSLATDINAYIDGHLIRSYNVNNRMAVVAEDLRAYGFWVIWYQEERELRITRPVIDNKVQYPYKYPQAEKTVLTQEIGTYVHDILYTDIKTYVNGREVEGFNINGETLIYFSELAEFGSVKYTDYDRTSRFTTDNDLVISLLEKEQEVYSGPWSFTRVVKNTSKTRFYGQLSADIKRLGYNSDGKGRASISFYYDVPDGITVTVTEETVSVSIYPAQFEDDEEFEESEFWAACEILFEMGIPDVSVSEDRTNTDEMRAAYAEIFGCSVNGRPVTGNLWIGRGNGHVDFNFDFTDGTKFLNGDVLNVYIGKKRYTYGDSDRALILIPADDATPEQLKSFFAKQGLPTDYNFEVMNLYVLGINSSYKEEEIAALINDLEQSGLFIIVNKSTFIQEPAE